MNRRILDNVVITALDKHGDESLTKSIQDMFGTGSLVEDAKTPVVSFDKSSFGLTNTNLSNNLRKVLKEFKSDSSECTVTDSSGFKHKVSCDALSILKALSFYRIICPEVISNCINGIINEIDDFFRYGNNKDSVTVTIEISKSGEIEELNNKNLMSQCRQEVFSLLREAGVNIGSS